MYNIKNNRVCKIMQMVIIVFAHFILLNNLELLENRRYHQRKIEKRHAD